MSDSTLTVVYENWRIMDLSAFKIEEYMSEYLVRDRREVSHEAEPPRYRSLAPPHVSFPTPSTTNVSAYKLITTLYIMLIL